MHFIVSHKIWSVLILFFVLVVGLVLVQYVYIRLNGSTVYPPTIPRTTERFGSTGPKLTYVVMGDSTSIGQGADYDNGIARNTTRYLAKNYQIALTNVGISGARVADVQRNQLAKAVQLKPDVVLLAIGANDVTHFTSLGTVQTGASDIITQLQAANPNVAIVLTGSPAMGAVPRFAKPTQWLAHWRTKHINDVFATVAATKHVVLVPLAAQTEQIFLQHPEVFAQDNFHPNAAGYAVWLPILYKGLGQALAAHKR